MHPDPLRGVISFSPFSPLTRFMPVIYCIIHERVVKFAPRSEPPHIENPNLTPGHRQGAGLGHRQGAGLGHRQGAGPGHRQGAWPGLRTGPGLGSGGRRPKLPGWNSLGGRGTGQHNLWMRQGPRAGPRLESRFGLEPRQEPGFGLGPPLQASGSTKGKPGPQERVRGTHRWVQFRSLHSVTS